MKQKFIIKTLFGFLLLLLIVTIFYACKHEFLNPYDDEIPDNWPSIKHDTIYVDMNQIVAKATITKSKSKILQRGFCWSENHTPTIADSKADIGSSESISSFQANPSGLIVDKTYHFRAYVTNLSRTVYSNDIIFIPKLIYKISNVTYSAPPLTTVSGFIKGTFLQGVKVAEYGVCYSTNNSPTITDNKVSLGTFKKDSIFNINVQSLVNNTDYYFKIYRTDSIGSNYSDVFQFKIPIGLAIVETDSVKNITLTTVTCGGNVISTGGTAVSARGVCWSTNSNPVITDGHTTDGTGAGTFVSSLTGLSANTTYYIRAYAINSNGTSYGSTRTFITNPNLPTLTTTTISNITSTSAKSGGNITNDGGGVITARGICWATSQNPTLSNNHTTDSIGSGIFTSNITGLSANTTYYVRAYATNFSGTSFGNQVSFTTTNTTLSILTTTAISNISINTATSGGNITSAGGGSVTARGVCWSTSHNPVISGSHSTDGTGIGNFISSITGLTASTLYYVRAYATNAAGTAYGNEVSLTTLPANLPTITTTSASGITQTIASSGGDISNDGGAPITARGVCWSTSQNPSISDSHSSDGIGIGPFTSSITGLTPNTTYYIRSYATNIVGTAYGAQKSFTTLQIVIPLLTTVSASNITELTVSSGGSISSDGGSTISARGVCWSISHNPTIIDSHTTDGTGIGNFASSITSLSSNTVYYIRAYATNNAGTAYGNEITITTLASITTSIISNITDTSAISGGIIAVGGGSIISARGICWSTSQNPTITGNHTTDGAGTGSYASSIFSLTASTTYYVRAYATNSTGTSYGNQQSFTTNTGLATITTTTVSSITFNTAQSGGVVLTDGGLTISARGVCWSTSQNPTIADSHTTDGTTTGSFISSITGLTYSTTYYVRAYVTNSAGTAYGTQINFTTSGAPTIGQNYGGGIIFYIDGSGQHGLIAASSDQTGGSTYYNYGCTSSIAGANGTAIGTGNQNTITITANCTGTTFAAKICSNLVLNGYTDWYLPSKDELNQLYLHRSSVGGFTTVNNGSGYYWSSSESDNSNAWITSFFNGTQSSYPKINSISVRAIRSF